MSHDFGFSPTGFQMFVHFVTENPSKIPAVRAMLESRYRIVCLLRGKGDAQTGSNGVLMVDADLRVAARVEQIRISSHPLQHREGPYSLIDSRQTRTS